MKEDKIIQIMSLVSKSGESYCWGLSESGVVYEMRNCEWVRIAPSPDIDVELDEGIIDGQTAEEEKEETELKERQELESGVKLETILKKKHEVPEV